MNLRNLILVSRAINEAALARENSRGSHYREDFPQSGELESSYYTVVGLQQDQLKIENRQVLFTRVQPGQTILVDA
jgi:fumarate reductase flavoprotein subunit